MKNILILGAGKSATVLIDYMLTNAVSNNWLITIGDVDVDTAKRKLNGHPCGSAVYFTTQDELVRNTLIEKSDLIISLLPAHLHIDIAKACVAFKKNFVSASFVSDAMRMLHTDAQQAGIILLNEMGLDPGIDHMSSMHIIHRLKNKGADITAFESYTGGLVAPEHDTNPWHYKFSWNPRNVVLAGQGTAKFLWNGCLKYIPYTKLFSRYDVLTVKNYGDFEGYPNRDSLSYRELYELQNASTLVRGTLRRRGYCDAWNVFVQLGITDDSYQVEGIEHMTWNSFIQSFLPYANTSTRANLAAYLHIEDATVLSKLDWLGIFSNDKIGMQTATPAQVLQKLLEEKWKLNTDDKDMVVMLHKCTYMLDNKKFVLQSNMVEIGENAVITAMAKTVGLPLGIAAKMILNNDIKKTGVVIPVTEDIYAPVLAELKNEFGVTFYEEEVMM